MFGVNVMRENKLIQFYLTNMCNSLCKTCNIWQNKPESRQELDFEFVKNVIKEYPYADFVFGGGEVTLYSQLDELLKYCDAHDVNYTLLTNAINLRKVEKILNSYNVKNLTISCDGLKHDSIRVQDRIKNLDNIIYLVKKYLGKIENLKISYTLSVFNENHIDEDMEFFKSLGIEKIYFCIAQNMELLGAKGKITPSTASLKYLYETYGYMLYDRDKEFLNRLLYGEKGPCQSLNNVHTIYTDGSVVMCQSYMCDNILGNIKHEPSLHGILKDSGIESRIFDCPFVKECELVCQRRYD